MEEKVWRRERGSWQRWWAWSEQGRVGAEEVGDKKEGILSGPEGPCKASAYGPNEVGSHCRREAERHDLPFIKRITQSHTVGEQGHKQGHQLEGYGRIQLKGDGNWTKVVMKAIQTG